MSKEEVIKILVLIESVYSDCMTKDETVMHWFEFCQLMDYEKVIQKLHAHIRKSPYPPAILDLAVFTEKKNSFPEKLEQWIKVGREQIEHDRDNGKRKQVPAWMLEYSTRTK